MVRKILILLFILFYNNSISQEQKELWWMQTPLNKKYEKNYKFVFSEIEDGVLKEQIIEFIKTYIYKSEEEIAIEISSVFSKKRNEYIYRITYMTHYYNFIPYELNINQIAEVQGKIIFIKNHNLNDFKINKKVLFGLLRDRYPKVLTKNNISYSKDGTYLETWTTDHHVPNYILTIKNNELIDKKISFD